MNRVAAVTTLMGLLAVAPAIAQSEAPHGTDPAGQRDALERALADFDAAVALGDHTSPQARQLYRRAADTFASIIGQGIENGHLYYNLANAQLRLGETGPAIVSYRRALRLMPGNENVRRNLRFARNLREVRIQPRAVSTALETVFFWHHQTSHAARTTGALACYTAFWILMMAGLPARRRLPPFIWTTRLVGLLALILAASVAWDRLAAAHRNEGVLITDDVVLRKGNGASYDPQLETPLAEGIEFRLIETRDDLDGNTWYYVELPDGTDGWLRGDLADLI